MSSRPIPPDLLPWALTALGYSPGDDIPKHAVSPVAGDAGNRRYFRLDCASERYILADAPPQTEKNAEFVAIGQVLSDAQVRVPKILAADTQRGFLLLEDLGDRTLLAYLNGESVDAWYRKSGLILQKMAAIDLGRVAVPSYDAAILDEELSRFSAWFVEDLLDYPLSVSEKAMIGDLNARHGARTQDILAESGLAFAPIAGSTYHLNYGINLFGAIDHIGLSAGLSADGPAYVLRDQFGGEWPADHYPVVADITLN